MRRLPPVIVLPLAVLWLSSTAVLAQRGSVEGEVVLEDDSPVAGAVISAQSVENSRLSQQTKSNKKGRFVLPFLESGSFRFEVEKPGLLIRSISATTLDPDRRTVNEYATEVGALQELPELQVQSSHTLRLRFVMVPEKHFDVPDVVRGDRQSTEWLRQANDLTIEGRYEESTKLLLRIVEEGTTNASVFYLLGTNAYALGRREESARWLARTEELNPEQPGLHAYLGNLASDAGDLERALAEYDRELVISPDAVPVAINRAILLVRLDRKEEAIAAFEAVIESNPERIDAYSELAGLYLDMGREQEAADVLDRLAAIGKADPAMWFNVGAGLSNRGLQDQAREAYRKALELDPNFAAAIRELGYLEIGAANPTAAAELFEKYLSLRPDAPDAESVRAILQKLRAGSAGS